MGRWKQGLFKPANPRKYVGNTHHIVYRSWLEFRVMMRLDQDPNVVKWASEEFYIPYIHPGDGKMHRYFVDLFYERKDGKKYIAEVKPFEQTLPPKRGAKYLHEQATFAVNMAKWTAAERWAKQKGCQFIKITDKDLPDGRKSRK